MLGAGGESVFTTTQFVIALLSLDAVVAGPSIATEEIGIDHQPDQLFGGKETRSF